MLFIGEDRHIVTDIAGTTRDSIYTKYNKFGLNFYLVDTAGIRKKGKVNEDLEYYSVIRSIPRDRELGCLRADVGRYEGHREPGYEYLLAGAEE